MKISVVTISFNQAKFLRQCIESVLAQNYSNLEYIIVDAGSTDGSREIISSFGDVIIKIFEADDGPADGLNKGFSRATGDIFYFINADDFLLDDSFRTAIQLFEKYPRIDVLLAGGIGIDENNVRFKRFFPSKISPQAYVNGAVTFFQQGMFFRSTAYKSVHGFNPLNKTCWDGELLLQFMCKGFRFRRIMTQLGAFRVHPESITGSNRLAKELGMDRQRLFEMVYGKEQMAHPFMASVYRWRKLIFDIHYLSCRLFLA